MDNAASPLIRAAKSRGYANSNALSVALTEHCKRISATPPTRSAVHTWWNSWRPGRMRDANRDILCSFFRWSTTDWYAMVAESEGGK